MVCASDVERAVIGLLAEERGDVRARNIADMDEIASLVPVFEHSGRVTALVRAAEDARDARVRSVARHSRPVDVVVAQRRDRGALVLAGERRAQVLLMQLGGGIHVARVDRRVLGHGLGDELAATLDTGRIVLTQCDRRAGTRRRAHDSVLGAAIAPLAVDHHAAGQHDSSGKVPLVQGAQQHRSADVIVVDILVDIRKIDAETDHRALM